MSHIGKVIGQFWEFSPWVWVAWNADMSPQQMHNRYMITETSNTVGMFSIQNMESMQKL